MYSSPFPYPARWQPKVPKVYAQLSQHWQWRIPRDLQAVRPCSPRQRIFDFTATAPFFNSGVIEVPVGECSGAIQAPSGTVTLTEAPAIGAQTSVISAYGYNQNGYRVNRLLTSNPAEQTATVSVVEGGVNLETIATFTNYAPPPGSLKVCKIAGQGVVVGTPFTFDITGLRPIQIEAGPADQGGFCSVVGSFPYNTPETIAEVVPSGISVSNITVTPANRGSDQTLNSVVATIGEGITEVDFTDVSVATTGSCQPSESLSVLVSGTNVIAYVPHGRWSSGGTSDIGVLNVEGTSITNTRVLTPGDIINSCASNWTTGKTVCTADNNDAYLLSGTSFQGTNPFTTSATGTINNFSGGDCTNCGVSMDGVNNRALVGMSIDAAGDGGWQLLDLSTAVSSHPGDGVSLAQLCR